MGFNSGSRCADKHDVGDYAELLMTDLADPSLLADESFATGTNGSNATRRTNGASATGGTNGTSETNGTKRPRSVAVAGRPFTTEASRWNRNLLAAAEAISDALSEPTDVPVALHKLGPHHDSALLVGSRRRASHRLVAAWVCGVLLGELAPDSSLMDAEEWFAGSTTFTTALPTVPLDHARALLGDLVCREGALEMLPYALDPIPHEYRRDIVNGNGSGAARTARKRQGSFYTPTDVADHIVSTALRRVPSEIVPVVLDPAVGTGVFLRATFTSLLERGHSADEAITCLHGIDINECAVDMAAFVLLVDFVLASQSPLREVVFETWWQIRSQFLVANSLLVLDGVGCRSRLLVDHDRQPPQVGWLGERFDVIVGNPPYSRLGESADIASLSSRFLSFESASSSTDIYLGFVELLCSQLRPKGAGTFVVPMSIGYSTTRTTQRLREVAFEAKGRWAFEFFDRTPDALFGDDVKQRTAIVTRQALQDHQLVTSAVMRWSSSNRQGLFERIPQIELGSYSFVNGVPKVGSCAQATGYRSLRPSRDSLGDHAIRWQRVSAAAADGAMSSLYVAGTAYNWLNVYRTASSICSEVDNPTASPLSELTFANPMVADATYALLSSRLIFWLWRAEGDAFHVTNGWLRDVPTIGVLGDAELVAHLAEIGRCLWLEVSKHPIVSVNGGKTTQSYCPHAYPELLDSVDRVLLAAAGLPSAFGDELTQFVHETTTAGRQDSDDRGLQRALAAWRKD